MTTPTPTATAYQLDANGFPAVDCGRCGGSGAIPRFGSVCKGVCFGCGGSGLTYPTKKVRVEAMAAHGALKKASEVLGSFKIIYNIGTGEVTRECGFVVGQDVRPEQYIRNADGDLVPAIEWRTIAAVRHTARVLYGGIGGRIHYWALETVVTFTDGTRKTIDSTNWVGRPSAELLADIARRAADSRTAYDKLLARRAARKA